MIRRSTVSLLIRMLTPPLGKLNHVVASPIYYGKNLCLRRWIASDVVPKRQSDNEIGIVEIVHQVAKAHDLTFAQTKRILYTFFGKVGENLKEGKKVSLGNFGRFGVKHAKIFFHPRDWFHPSTRGKNNNKGEE